MSDLQTSLKFLRSAASTTIYCEPATTKVVIATCGGIVPGMNVVIRSLVKCLEQEYGVDQIFGAKYGLAGLAKAQNEWVKLTSESLHGIQDKGGSILGTQGPNVKIRQIYDRLTMHSVRQVYLIGGAGTPRAANELKDLARRSNT